MALAQALISVSVTLAQVFYFNACDASPSLHFSVCDVAQAFISVSVRLAQAFYFNACGASPSLNFSVCEAGPNLLFQCLWC